MLPLRKFNDVSYLQLVSVYRDYESTDDLEAEVTMLRRRGVKRRFATVEQTQKETGVVLENVHNLFRSASS